MMVIILPTYAIVDNVRQSLSMLTDATVTADDLIDYAVKTIKYTPPEGEIDIPANSLDGSRGEYDCETEIVAQAVTHMKQTLRRELDRVDFRICTPQSEITLLLVGICRNDLILIAYGPGEFEQAVTRAQAIFTEAQHQHQAHITPVDPDIPFY